MDSEVLVNGMIIQSTVFREYDLRLVILTRERGKITVFANGAKRPKSPLHSKTSPFSYGIFTLIPGRDSYRMKSAQIKNYFRDIVLDYNRACYGFYFLEYADYCTYEGNDESEMLKLLYISLNALMKESIPARLTRYIFELRQSVVNGEYPDVYKCASCGKDIRDGYFSVKDNSMFCTECDGSVRDKIYLDESTVYTMQYIISAPLEKLYSFTVSEEVLSRLGSVIDKCREYNTGKHFKTLDVLMSDLD